MMEITITNADLDISYQDCSQMKVSIKAEDSQGNLIIIKTNASKLKELVDAL